MKKIAFLLFAIIATATGHAQNVQLLYDLGNPLYGKLDGRAAVTTTVEMFKPDKWGSTYLFTDMDYYSDGVGGAYWEIYREFNISRNKQWALHIEYNGGLSTIKNKDVASRFQHAALFGGAWNWAGDNGLKTFSAELMYKQYFKGQGRGAYSSFQATIAWGNTFAHGLGTFSGFADLWYDDAVNGHLIFNSEPQIWFNFNALRGWEDINLSIGSEVRISNNFVYDDHGRCNKFYVIPTLGVKWTFN